MDNIPSLPLLLSGVASPGYCDMGVREENASIHIPTDASEGKPRSKWNEILCMPWLIGLPNLGSSQGGVSRTSKTSGAYAVIKARAGWCVLQFRQRAVSGIRALIKHTLQRGTNDSKMLLDANTGRRWWGAELRGEWR